MEYGIRFTPNVKELLDVAITAVIHMRCYTAVIFVLPCHSSAENYANAYMWG